jgi:excinuclease ABC subunit A
MRYLPSTWIPCSDCDGLRFSEEVLAARVDFVDRSLSIDRSLSSGRSLSIADFYALPAAEARPLLSNETWLPPGDHQAGVRILQALLDIGLGYLALGQPSPTLSGGEAQRVKLARYLGRKSLARQMLVLDEPSTGLHPQDLAGLLAILDRLARAGDDRRRRAQHRRDPRQDWIIELGLGAGPQGGRLLYAGRLAG